MNIFAMLYEVGHLPSELYRQGRIDQRYHQTVQKGRGSDRVFVEAPTPLTAFSTVLAEQHHGVLTRLTGRVFFKSLLGISEDQDVSKMAREEKERLLARKGYVKLAPQGVSPDYIFEGSGSDRAQSTSQAVAASRRETYRPVRPVRPVDPDTSERSRTETRNLYSTTEPTKPQDPVKQPQPKQRQLDLFD